VMGGDFGEPFITPPKGTGLGEAVTKMSGILQGQPGGGEAAQTESTDEMLAGLKGGNLLMQPWEHFFDHEAAKLVVAGKLLFAGLHRQMIEKGESDGRQSMAVEQLLENGKGLHLLQIEFAIEEKAEALGLIGGGAQQMDGMGVTHGRIGDGIAFEFGRLLWFCHAKKFNYGRSVFLKQSPNKIVDLVFTCHFNPIPYGCFK
jgi:hypothetical protein